MEFHRWLLATRSGESLEGEDGFPPESAKCDAESFQLYFPVDTLVVMPDGRDSITRHVEVLVPEGHGLVFKRRVQIHMGENGKESAPRNWRYILNFVPLQGD